MTRRQVLQLLGELSSIGMLRAFAPALFLIPEVAPVLAEQIAQDTSTGPPLTPPPTELGTPQTAGMLPDDVLKATNSYLEWINQDLHAAYEQFQNHFMELTAPQSATDEGLETVGQYLTQLEGGEPVLGFSFGVAPRLRIGNLTANVSVEGDPSVSIPVWEAINLNLGKEVGIGVGVRRVGLNIGTNITSGDPNLRVSLGFLDFRAYGSVQVKQGFYNILYGLLRDLDNNIQMLVLSQYGYNPPIRPNAYLYP